MIERFDEQAHIAKMKPHTDKLLSYLKKKGIAFTSDDGEGNIIFRGVDKELKIAKHCFYRFSGIACIHREVGESSVEMIEVDDDMFMNSYMKAVIDHNFDSSKNSKK